MPMAGAAVKGVCATRGVPGVTPGALAVVVVALGAAGSAVTPVAVSGVGGDAAVKTGATLTSVTGAGATIAGSGCATEAVAALVAGFVI